MSKTLKELLAEIKGDMKGQAGLSQFIRAYLYSASFRVLLNHRIGKYCFNSGNYILRRIALRYRYRLITRRNCDISYNAYLGKGIRLPHPLGIVIGDGVIIKDNVAIFQQVTLGSHGRIDRDLQYPVIEDNVKIYAGAKIIGGVTIGANSVIGANSLINKDIPVNSIAYGSPCQIKPRIE